MSKVPVTARLAILCALACGSGCGSERHHGGASFQGMPQSQDQARPHQRQEGEVESAEVTVTQVRFRGAADAVWKVPAQGQTSKVNLTLGITNDSGGSLQFHVFDTLQIRLCAADGTAWRYKAARDATSRAGRFSPPLSPGQTFTLSRPAKLEWQANETLRLSGFDGFGGLWWFDGLRPGRYSLEFVYENDTDKTDKGDPLWRGKATPLVPIRIE